MKQIYYILLIFLFNTIFMSCRKEASSTNQCLSLKSNDNWVTENFKNGYSIQFPSSYEGNGMVGFEGNVFYKSRKDEKIKLRYSFCSPLSCADFGEKLVNPNDVSVLIIDENGQQQTSDKKINICENDKIVGVYYYTNKSNSIGKLFWEKENAFREALTIEYDMAFQNEVEQILVTIKKK